MAAISFHKRLVVGLRPLEDLADRGGRTALAQEFARLLAQLFQFVAEIEVHARPPDGDQPYTRASVPPMSLARSLSDRRSVTRNASTPCL